MAFDDGPSGTFAAITPSDSALFDMCRAIYVGGVGDVKLSNGANSVTFTAMPVGTVLPVRATKVFATGTTATNLVALY